MLLISVMSCKNETKKENIQLLKQAERTICLIIMKNLLSQIG